MESPGICWALLVVASIVITTTRGSDFVVITNTPELCREPGCVLYKYAITTDPAILDNIRVRKDGEPVTGWVKTEDLVRASDGVNFGCYLTVRTTKGQRVGGRYGIYQWSTTVGDDQVTINSFVKPETAQLDTRGMYTITVYPDQDDPTMLSEPLKFGVKYQPGCEKIKWNKGRRRGVNNGRMLALTEVEGAAGVYEIYRGTRRSRGWSVHIEVIVSDCPEGTYRSTPLSSCTSNCPPAGCANGGVCTSGGLCRCPPFFRGDHCRFPDAWVNRPGTNTYYYIGSQSLTWTEGRTACQEIGGDLASITSEADTQFIVGLLDDIMDISPTLYASIGLEYDPGTDIGTWASGEALEYTNWFSPVFPISNSLWTSVIMFVTGANLGQWRNSASFQTALFLCERENVRDPLVIKNEEHITCGQLPGGNNECEGYQFCYGDLYGCTCASGWRGNACDQECQVGFYGPDCKMHCVKDAGCSEKRCNRFTGRC